MDDRHKRMPFGVPATERLGTGILFGWLCFTLSTSKSRRGSARHTFLELSHASLLPSDCIVNQGSTKELSVTLESQNS